MKTARERAGNATGCRINGEMHVPVDQVVDMLREHEAEVRADERAKALTLLREYRASVKALDSFATWENHDVLEDLDKLIAQIDGGST